MAEFGLIRPFDIDNGQLDGLTPQHCFALGYELALVDAQIAAGEPFERLLHVANRDRVLLELERKGARYDIGPTPKDESGSWLTLKVY